MTDEIKVTPSDLDSWYGKSNSTLLDLTMRALRAVLIRRFKQYVQKRVYYEFTPNMRAHMMLRRSAKGQVNERATGASLPVPFITVGVQDITFPRDRFNLKAMKRSGVFAFKLDGQGQQPDNLEQAKDTGGGWLLEAKVFPIEANLVLSYVDSDVKRMFDIGSQIPLLTLLGALTFRVQFDKFEFEASVTTDDPKLTAPSSREWVGLEAEEAAGIQTFQFPMKLNTYMAILRKSPGVRQMKSKIKDMNSNEELN